MKYVFVACAQIEWHEDHVKTSTPIINMIISPCSKHVEFYLFHWYLWLIFPNCTMWVIVFIVRPPYYWVTPHTVNILCGVIIWQTNVQLNETNIRNNFGTELFWLMEWMCNCIVKLRIVNGNVLIHTRGCIFIEMLSFRNPHRKKNHGLTIMWISKERD